ncbi:hypothetical protein ACQ4LE_010564 [Meloidogyne hapla]
MSTKILFFLFSTIILFQFINSQYCASRTFRCNDGNRRCCKGLNCKSTLVNGNRSEFQCYKGDCIKKGNPCNGNGCCYGTKCEEVKDFNGKKSSKCVACSPTGTPCSMSSSFDDTICCSGICGPILGSESTKCY